MQSQSGSGSSEPQKEGDTSCEIEVIGSQKVAIKDSDAVVSPVISHAAANSREQLKTETNASKSCNQSGSKPVDVKPNCYQCKYRRELAGDCHSSCGHSSASPLALLLFSRGLTEFNTEQIHVRGNTHGVRSGWFMWPLNYDPTWLEICTGFEQA